MRFILLSLNSSERIVVPNGAGTLLYPDGSVFVGNFLDGLASGVGELKRTGQSSLSGSKISTFVSAASFAVDREIPVGETSATGSWRSAACGDMFPIEDSNALNSSD